MIGELKVEYVVGGTTVKHYMTQPLTKAFQVMNPKILPQLKNILKNL